MPHYYVMTGWDVHAAEHFVNVGTLISAEVYMNYPSVIGHVLQVYTCILVARDLHDAGFISV